MKWIKNCLKKLIHHHRRFETLSFDQEEVKTYHQEYIAFWK